MGDQEIKQALDRHWAASDVDDFEEEHQIYRDDAVLEYPQSGERISGRRNIQASRTAQPNKKRFAVRRIVGSGDLWVTEYVLTYDGKTVLHSEHHGVSSRRSRSGNAIFRRSIHPGRFPFAMG